MEKRDDGRGGMRHAVRGRGRRRDRRGKNALGLRKPRRDGVGPGGPVNALSRAFGEGSRALPGDHRGHAPCRLQGAHHARRHRGGHPGDDRQRGQRGAPLGDGGRQPPTSSTPPSRALLDAIVWKLVPRRRGAREGRGGVKPVPAPVQRRGKARSRPLAARATGYLDQDEGAGRASGDHPGSNIPTTSLRETAPDA